MYSTEVTDKMIRTRYNQLLFNIKEATKLNRLEALTDAHQEMVEVIQELDKRGMRA